MELIMGEQPQYQYRFDVDWNFLDPELKTEASPSFVLPVFSHPNGIQLHGLLLTKTNVGITRDGILEI
jgi:hypothetical protein